jgi:surface-anchored protein
MRNLIRLLSRLRESRKTRSLTKSTKHRPHRPNARLTLLVELLEGRRLMTTLPTISDVVDRSTLESTATTAIAFTVGDVETPAASLSMSGSSSNPALVPNGNIVFGGSGTSRTLTITPAAGLSGTATISLTVTDTDLNTATDTFILTVTPVYQLPGETIPDLVMNADSSTTINYQITNSAWVSSVTRTNESLFNTPGTSSSSDLRTQPTSGGTLRTLRVRPRPGLYGESDVTLGFTGAGAPGPSSFKVTVYPRAIADNLLGVAGKTSTFDILRNDTAPQIGSSVSIVSFTQPTNGTLVAGSVPGTLRYTPNIGFAGIDLFTYTSQYNLGPSVTQTGYVTVAQYVNVDTVHTDLRVGYNAGAWSNEVRADLAFGVPNQGGVSNPTILDYDESLLMVNPASIITLPTTLNTTQFNFLGRGPDEPIWNLPQAQKAGVLWPGINTESIAIGTFASYAPTGDPRATANARWLRFEMVDYRIPVGSVFSMSQSGTTPVVFFDSMDGVNGPNETAIGNNVSDTFWITENTHAHMNWWFTHPGRYEIDVRTKGFIDQGGGNLVEVTSPISTLHFMVYGSGDPTTTGPLTEAPPKLSNDNATAVEDGGPVVIDVLANDRSDPDPLERLSVTSVTNGTKGTVTVSLDGQSVSYTPAPNLFGSDSFTYTVTDEHGGVASATVSVVISPQANPTITITSGNVVYSDSVYVATASVTEGSAPDPTSSLAFTYFSDLAGTMPISAPENAGTYYVQAFTAANAGNNAAQSPITQFTISPALLLGSITAANKPFDGNTIASILTRALTGVLGADQVIYQNGTATFDTAAVGSGKTVTTTGLSLGGADAANYTVNTTAVTTASILDVTAPTVTRVIVGGSTWSPAFIDAVDGGGAGAGNGLGYELTPLLTLPNLGINRIYIEFSEPVVGFTAASFKLLGVNVADYASISTVGYDSMNHRGVIALSSNIIKDKLRIGVSDAVRDASPSQNLLDGDATGSAGGIFDFRFNVLIGDSSNEGSVNGGDLSIFAVAFNKSAGNAGYNSRADWNSDGSVNGGDLSFFASNFNQSLPSGNPGSLNFPPPPILEADFDSNSVFAPLVDSFFRHLEDEDEFLLLEFTDVSEE